MTSLEPDSPLAVAATRAIREGQVEELERLLAAHPPLAKARIDGQRTLLHVVTDWPGNFPRAAATVAALVAAGADVDAPFIGPHGETPLHWAASSDDLEALDALLTAGADTEAPGSVINGGTALADAVAFGQWRAAHRLVERGARANLWQAAALGLLERVEAELAGQPRPTPDDITNAFCARATAASARRRNTCSPAAPSSTGSGTTTSRRWTPLGAAAPATSFAGCASAAHARRMSRRDPERAGVCAP